MSATPRPFDGDPRRRRVERGFRDVLEAFGLDLRDPELADTPARMAAAWGELLSGLEARQDPVLRTFPNTEAYSDTVAMTGIPFHSLCAHHFLPFFGTADVGYLPGDRVAGLSKLARAVDHCARRPQVQERLTEQVAALLERRLAPRGVIVVVRARHFCMEMRGVAKSGAVTTTTAVRGAFADEGLRREFLGLSRHPS